MIDQPTATALDRVRAYVETATEAQERVPVAQRSTRVHTIDGVHLYLSDLREVVTLTSEALDAAWRAGRDSFANDLRRPLRYDMTREVTPSPYAEDES